MQSPPDRVPSELRAGDTLRFRRALHAFLPVDGWDLKYTIVSATEAHSFTAGVANDEFLIEVLSATTIEWGAGRYQVQEYVERSGDRVTISTPQLRVLANLAGVTDGIDTRSHARRVLEAIEAWLESKNAVAGAMQIGDRRVQTYPIEQLLAMRDRYRAEVARETGQPARLLMRL